MSPVAALGRSRFHRAHVKPARRRARGESSLSASSSAQSCAVAGCACGVPRRGTFLSTLGTAPDRPHRVVGQPAHVGRGDVAGDPRTACAARTSCSRISTRGGRADGVAVGPRRVVRRSLPVNRRSRRRTSARRSRSAGSAGGSIWSTSAASSIDEYGPQYADLDLPIVDGSARHQSRRHRPIDDARGELARARLIMALRQKPAVAQRACRRSTSPTCTTRRSLLSDDPADLRSATITFCERWSRTCRCRALRERVPESTTWTCDSTAASTCGRLGKPAGQCGRGGARTGEPRDRRRQH